jgi:hypothetical protein
MLLVDSTEDDNPPALLVDERAHTVAPFSVALLRHGANRRLGLRGYTPRGGESLPPIATADAFGAAADDAPVSWSAR